MAAVALHCALDRPDVEQVAFEYLGAERAQPIRAFVDPVDEGTNRNPACEQHFGCVAAGLTLSAAGR
jgi:hypothetical protein